MMYATDWENEVCSGPRMEDALEVQSISISTRMVLSSNSLHRYMKCVSHTIPDRYPSSPSLKSLIKAISQFPWAACSTVLLF